MPQSSIVLQGFTSELTDAPTWMVDPVDGTTNFVHRFPFVCVAIGLAINKQVLLLGSLTSCQVHSSWWKCRDASFLTDFA